jgi:uncharacterized protein (DUF433 family)
MDRIQWEWTVLAVAYGQTTVQPNEIVVKDQDILGGIPVFRGTRVPLQALLDYLEGGQTLDEFLDDFPTVTKDAAVAVLELAQSLLVGQLG